MQVLLVSYNFNGFNGISNFQGYLNQTVLAEEMSVDSLIHS